MAHFERKSAIVVHVTGVMRTITAVVRTKTVIEWVAIRLTQQLSLSLPGTGVTLYVCAPASIILR